MQSIHAIAAALLMGGALAAQAADRDTRFHPGELLTSNAEYRQAWQDLVKDEERLPEWLINLSGLSTPMQAVEADSDRYLVGQVCEALLLVVDHQVARVVADVRCERQERFAVVVRLAHAVVERTLFAVEFVGLGVTRALGHLNQVQIVQLPDRCPSGGGPGAVVEHEMHQIPRAVLADGGSVQPELVPIDARQLRLNLDLFVLQVLQGGLALWQSDRRQIDVGRYGARGDLATACDAGFVNLSDLFQHLVPGPIELDELRYWSVARQEPYATAEISVKAALDTAREA